MIFLFLKYPVLVGLTHWSGKREEPMLMLTRRAEDIQV
jgi:hypothetical protein